MIYRLSILNKRIIKRREKQRTNCWVLNDIYNTRLINKHVFKVLEKFHGLLLRTKLILACPRNQYNYESISVGAIYKQKSNGYLFVILVPK